MLIWSLVLTREGADLLLPYHLAGYVHSLWSVLSDEQRGKMEAEGGMTGH